MAYPPQQTSSKTVNLFPLSAWLGLVSLLLVMLSFHKTLGQLWNAWQTDEYSHSLLIPVIATFIGWHRLAEIKPEMRPSWGGPICLIAAILLLALGHLSVFVALEEYAIILALISLSLTFIGRKASYLLLPSWFFLLFAVPLPNLVQVTLSQKLQLVSSALGVSFIDLLGISVYRDGNVIDLGNYKLQVVDACSGLRYIFPLMSFGYLIAFLYQGRLWQRLFLFLSTIPIAVFMNALRIGAVGLTVHLWGAKMAEGVLHEIEGWVVFAACLFLLATEIWIMYRLGSKGKLALNYMSLPKGTLTTKCFNKDRIATTTLLIAVLLAIVTTMPPDQLRRKKVTPEHTPLATFPLEIKDWHGSITPLEANIVSTLKLTDYWLAQYTNSKEQEPVNLYIAYYQSQQAGTITHTPASCIPSGGWEIQNKSTRTVALSQGTHLSVSRMLVRKGEDSLLIYYWFDQRGRNLTETYLVKLYLIIDSLFLNRTDGSLIRLVTPLGKQEMTDKADQRIQTFLSAIYPQIQIFLPAPTEL